jgi:hypothetical protein
MSEPVLSAADAFAQRPPAAGASWRESALFSGLSDAQAAALATLLRPLTLDAGAYLVREGETARDLFFLESGSLEVLKAEAGTGREHAIARIEAGQVVGEMALISGKPRAASVRARESVRLLALPLEALAPGDGNGKGAGGPREGALRDAYVQLVGNMAATLSDRLRKSNDDALEAAQARLAMGQFTVNIFLLLAIYVLVLGCLPLLRHLLPDDSSYITVPLLVVYGGIVFHFMRVSGYPLATFGITTDRLGRVVAEGALSALPLVALLTALKWAVLRFGPARADALLFDYRGVFARLGARQFLVILVVYMVFTSVQELIVRGALQSALQRFLVSKRRTLTAIVVSNILFSVVHMHLSPAFALAVFPLGLYWGWLYLRQHHLAGVTTSHLVVGVYLFFVLGPL